MHDWQLLRQYVDEGSNRAFDEIVERYGKLVYSVSLREARDPEMANDIFQTVFVILACKARRLRRGTVLSGWLYQTARLASREAIRQEMRRAAREQKAVEMNEPQSLNEDRLWEKADPMLHDALGTLSDFDRNLVLLRFFQEMSLGEAGEELGLSENAARMRVSRSLAKMRRFLEKHGAALTVATLATLLAERAAHADLPAGIVHAVTRQIAATSATSIPLTPIAKGVLVTMLHSQIKRISVAAGAVTAVLAVAGVAAHIVIAQNRATHPGDIGPVALVRQYLSAHASSNIPEAYSLLSSDSRRQLPVSDYDRLPPAANRAVAQGAPLPLIAFMIDLKNVSKTTYQIIGLEMSNPNVVDVAAALPNAKPITIKVVTSWDSADNARRIDAMQTVASSYPPLANAIAAKLESIACMSNMKDLSIAIYQYAQASGHLPDADKWMDEITPYVKDASEFSDPSDPNQRPYGYAYNQALSGLNISQIHNAPGTVLLFESTLGTKNGASLNSTLPDPGPIDGRTSVAFADGHVELVDNGARQKLNWQP